MIYFTISEYLTAAYGADAADVVWLQVLSQGPYAFLFWFLVVGGLVTPLFLLALRRSIATIVASAVLINVAMWVERFLIVVPTMMTPQTEFTWHLYSPSWVEWSITVGAVAGFALMYALFSKVFPIISIWEVTEIPEGAQPQPAPEPGPPPGGTGAGRRRRPSLSRTEKREGMGLRRSTRSTTGRRGSSGSTGRSTCRGRARAATTSGSASCSRSWARYTTRLAPGTPRSSACGTAGGSRRRGRAPPP